MNQEAQQSMELLPELRFCPAVYAVGNEYQIMVYAKSEILFWVTVNGEDYFDQINGIMRSSQPVHRVSVPMSELDQAGEYTIHYYKVIERKPYYTETEDAVSATYRFYPVPTDRPIHIYHLADTHGRYDQPMGGATWFGDQLDLLILNGDIVNHSGKLEYFDLFFRLCESLLGGERPCVCTRGNHDMRGIYAEKTADYMPNYNGLTYYTFRLGKLWGMVLDCAEDKPDSSNEYGHTVACHAFRRAQTRFIEQVIRDAEREYAAEGVEYRMVVSHVPFTQTDEPPFDIEIELYNQWLSILGEHVKPQLMLCGHVHDIGICHRGGKYDQKGAICPVILGAKPMQIREGEHKYVMVDFIGTAITLDGKKAQVTFVNSKKEAVEEHTLEI